MRHDHPLWPGDDSEMAAYVRHLDWASSPLGPIEAWSERLKLMVEQVLSNPLVSTLVCGSERILIYNDAAARLYGAHHPAALGRPLPMTFPQGWATVAPYYLRAFAGEIVQVAGQALDTRGEGEAADLFDALLMPVRESDGRVAYVHMTGSEVGQRARAEAALRASEAQFRTLADTAPALIWRNDERGRNVFINQHFLAFTGKSADTIRGEGWHRLVHPDEAGGYVADYLAAVRERRAWQSRTRIRRHDGEWRWFENYAQPLFGERGIYLGHVGVSTDISSSVEAEAALRESEERQAFLLALGDAMRAQPTPNAIIEAAARLLGERLEASRIMFAEFDEAKGIADIFFGWFADGARPFPAVMRLEEYEGSILDDLRLGRIVRIEDTHDPALARPDRAAIAELGVAALLSVPLIVGGRLLVNLSVHQHTARRWTDDEVALAQEVGERLWADLVRARAEATLAAAEAWQRALLEGIPQLVWRAVSGGEWTWASPQWTAYTGQSEPASRGWGWLGPLHPDDRPAARDVWGEAAERDGFDVEYRILGEGGGATAGSGRGPRRCATRPARSSSGWAPRRTSTTCGSCRCDWRC